VRLWRGHSCAYANDARLLASMHLVPGSPAHHHQPPRCMWGAAPAPSAAGPRRAAAARPRRGARHCPQPRQWARGRCTAGAADLPPQALQSRCWRHLCPPWPLPAQRRGAQGTTPVMEVATGHRGRCSTRWRHYCKQIPSAELLMTATHPNAAPARPQGSLCEVWSHQLRNLQVKRSK
jgi:hypothetical protein